MKRTVLSALLAFIYLNSYSQYLEKKWDHTFGGTNNETLTTLLQTADGGFLLAGFSNSDSSGDVSEFRRGGRDFWIIKTDSLGSKQWDKRFGSDLEDRLYSAEQTSDGGYILGGYTSSNVAFDVTEPSRGSLDYWIVKTDAMGNKQWDKRFGGSDYEWLNVVRQTNDGGYILGGYTYSPVSGDVSDTSRGGEDFWIVKTDASGIKQWDKRYGGNLTDALYDLRQTSDGGYILGGRCVSDNIGEVSQPSRGNNDYWIVKTDASGNKIWDKRFGGTENDNFLSLEQTTDGGYILGGYSVSDIGGDISETTRDTSNVISSRGDIWIVKVNATGIKQWDKRFGGSWIEDAFGYVTQTSDGGYLVGSASYSGQSGDKTENNFGYEQSWIVKTDSMGIKQWDKTLFVGGEDEYAYAIQSSDGCYVIANYSFGDSAGYKSEPSKGNYDFWIVKFCETSLPQLPVAKAVSSNPGICSGGCLTFTNYSFDSGTFLWNFSGAIPSLSTITSPTGICYSSPGTYSYSMIASNSSGNDTAFGSIEIYPLPSFSITRSDDTLMAPSNYSSYQWYLNSAAIPGANSYFIIAMQPGNYLVQIADSNFCPSSDAISIISVGINVTAINENIFSIYPNPVEDEMIVSVIDKMVGGEYTIYDVTGRKVFIDHIRSTSSRIQLSHLHPGIYFIEAVYGDAKIAKRFIKE